MKTHKAKTQNPALRTQSNIQNAKKYQKISIENSTNDDDTSLLSIYFRFLLDIF